MHKLISPRFDTPENIEIAFAVKSTPEMPLLLCLKHYAGLHHQFKTISCANCGATPKQGTCFTRHSPDTTNINDIINELNCSENDVHLSDSDIIICDACYKAQLAMLKSKSTSMSETNGSSELMSLIESWKATADDGDNVTKAVTHTLLYVASEFMHERAVLLPQASKVFLKAFNSENSMDQNEFVLEVKDGMVKFTSQWLLQQLIFHLQTHIEYKCVQKKFWTILFQKGGDFLMSLSWALGRGQLSDTDSICYVTCPPSSTSTILREAANIVNNLIHAEIGKNNIDNVYSQANPEEINIDAYIQTIDEDLWKFVELATISSSTGSNERNVNVKKLRRYFSVCILMYCTNLKPTKLHVYLADIIEMCGRSRNLIKLFNQLGAVALADTHDRFVTCIIKRERKKSIWD